VELLEQDERSLRRILDGLDGLDGELPASAGIDVIDLASRRRQASGRALVSTPRSTALRSAAAARSVAAEQRARHAIAELDRRGQPITFLAVAAEAGVSARYLYAHPQLRATIGQLRDEQQGPSRPHRHPRANDESIRARLRGALEENKQFRAENAQLRDELALAHGEIRELKLASRHRSTR